MAQGIAKAAFLAMTAFLAGAATGRAQTSEPPPPASATEDERRNIFTFQVENDVFNRFSPTDRDYTNGVRIGWLSPAIAWLPESWVALTTVPTFFGEAPSDSVIRRFGVSVGQNLYTPENITVSQPVFNDRPYAAWLYASFLLQYTYKRHDTKTGSDEPVRLDTLQVDVGLIGPAAGGELAQNNFHRLIGVPHANGCANQLHNEPTFAIPFGRRCPDRRSSSAMAASVGTCSPASTPRRSAATSSSTAIPMVTACESRTGRSSARPRPASPLLIAACASPILKCCARRNSTSATVGSSSARST